MKKPLLSSILAFVGFFTFQNAQAQFNFSEVEYWIGSGTDSSVLVVDFQNATWDSAYAWGYLHNGTATGEDMLNAIAAADVNFSVAIAGGFLNDIVYGKQQGIGGTNGFFWSTWSGTSIATLSMNAGISTSLANGEYFGCSFTDFSPALAPRTPIPAFEPFGFTAQDVDFWVGNGTDSAVLVVDFQDASGSSSFAWGYLYSGIATGQDMLEAVDAADANFSVAISGGFLNDITYNSFAGIGGNPNFWGTYSATNLGNWDLNIGIGDTLQNGELFGCSYTDFDPALRPGHPVAAPNTIGLFENEMSHTLDLYPNPASDVLFIGSDHFSTSGELNIKITDAMGRIVVQNTVYGNSGINVSSLPKGIYTLSFTEKNTTAVQRFIKQ